MTAPIADLATYIDHTLLKPEATRADVERLIAEGAELGTYSVCISPSFLPIDVPAGLKLAVVCGFPSGTHHAEIKAAEAALSVSQGADEIDMVIDVGAAVEGRYDHVEAEIRAVREAAPTPTVLKVIIESAALSDEAIIAVCEKAVAAGADFVKTSTGFHPAGGASVHAVELMKRTVGDRAQVKASGGVRTRAAAEQMIAAGATRLGLSSSRDILADRSATGDY
ncbi:deoxyribose-phosphate aldolase [Microbacterium sp. SORGH_AS 1204]|uniref:deoxyribose-phosphate aldolase n=1 Tax=Microbacterium sp. SORGH_AS_1204 TaxID=3041785 RepID=UPI00278CEFF4|nr:deoxyribose-phosphate aldolase [Microbacterium sp. SORGH_AS_1204]MDQ1136130.1 deoxyribose-phosphate aldolase [Microbacterium sp. SORGH_AS_1204]